MIAVVFLVLQTFLVKSQGGVCAPSNCSARIHNFPAIKDNATSVFRAGYVSYCGDSYTSAAEWVYYTTNMNSSILPDIRIDMYYQTVCKPTDVIVAVYDLIIDKKVKSIIIEAPEYHTSLAAQTAASYGVSSIAVSSTSELLDDKTPFNQLLARLSTPASLQSDAILQTLNHMKVKEVLYVYSNDVYGSQTYLRFVQKAMSWDVTVKPLAVSYGVVPPVLQMVIDSRALIFATNPSEGLPFLAALRNAGVYGPTYFYMFSLAMGRALSYNISDYPMVDGSLIILPRRYNIGSYSTYFNGWRNANLTMFPGDRTIYVGLPIIDAANIIVGSLDSLITEGYTEEEINGTLLHHRMLDMPHDSAVGPFRFSNLNDRVVNFTILNARVFVDHNFSFNITDVGLYDPQSNHMSFYPTTVYYFNGSTTVPVLVPRFSDLCSFSICHFRGNCSREAECICEHGFSGDYCETRDDNLIERDRVGSRIIAAWVVPVSVVVLVILISMYIFYRKRKAALLKGIAEKQRSEIPRDDIKLLDRIGRGASGEVMKAMFRGTEVAVKRLISATSSKSAVEEFMLETAIMCALRHPNVILFMGSSYDPILKEMLLVMEYMARGSAHDVIHNRKICLPYELQLHIILQAAQGMNFLHSSNPPVIHRDLKSHNILLDDKWNARISDFGITRFKEINKADNVKKKSKVAPASLGTIFWTAPEVLSGGSPTEASDCYSFGIVLWEVFHRLEPYSGIDMMVVATEVISKGLRPEISASCQNEIKELMRACWHQEPGKRPSFQDIVNTLRSLTALHPIHNIDSQTTNSRVEAPAGIVYFIHTELPDVYELWESAPRACQQAMKTYNQLVRTSLESCGGYEVSSAGSSFLGAFPTLQAALDWSFTIHTTLLHAQWPKQLLTLPAVMERKTESGELIWRGPRMRIAIHAGSTHSEHDHLRGCVVYSGPTVDRVQTMLQESNDIGDIVVSGTIHEEILEKKIHLTAMQIHHIGRYEEMDFYVLVNGALANRRPHGSLLPLLPVHTGAEATPHERAVAKEPKWLVKWDSLDFKESLGPGTVGEFYRAIWKDKEVAVKCLINQKVCEDDILELTANTVILSRINHPNLLPFYGICLEANHLAIITEYAFHGNLRALLSDETVALPLARRLRMAKDIAAGMTFLSMHSDPLLRVHDNFKSHNIMVDKAWGVKIADFGQASVKDLCRTMTSVTNVAWTAPEVLEGEPLNNNSSLYSFGIIMWEIITRKIPYQLEHPIKVVNKIIGGHRPPIPKEGIPQQYKDLMESCWHPYGNMRPSWHVINSELNFIVDGLPQ